MSVVAESMMVASDPLALNDEAVENGVLIETIDQKTTANIGIANLVGDRVMEEKVRRSLHVDLGENRTLVERPYRPVGIS